MLLRPQMMILMKVLNLNVLLQMQGGLLFAMTESYYIMIKATLQVGEKLVFLSIIHNLLGFEELLSLKAPILLNCL